MEKKTRKEFMIIAGVFFIVSAIYNIFLNLLSLIPIFISDIEFSYSYWFSFLGSFISIAEVLILGIISIKNKKNLVFPIIMGIRLLGRVITLVSAMILIILKSYGWEFAPYNLIASLLHIIAYALFIAFSISRYKEKNSSWIKNVWFIPAVAQAGILVISQLQNIKNGNTMAISITLSLGTVAYVIACLFICLYYKCLSREEAKIMQEENEVYIYNDGNVL